MAVQRAAGSSAVRDFLTRLFDQKPHSLYILIWTLPDKASRWFQDVGEAVRYAESRSDRDVYVGVSLSPQDFGAEKRCASDMTAGIVTLWADLDIRCEAHTKKNLPATVNEALALVPQLFTPTIVVHSGHGLHCWWVLKQPEIFQSDEHRDKVKTTVERWARLLKLNGAAHGWAVDRVFDLARVLRVPGTVNCKHSAEPRPVKIISTSEKRFNLSDFEEYMDRFGVPEPDQQSWLERWKEQQRDTIPCIRSDASVPRELIQHHCNADEQFRLIWHRQRNDFSDQSQSSYDMALADFGVKAGLTDQVIVDMLIEHRRIHGHRPKLRGDYYRRTLAKAHQYMDQPVMQDHADEMASAPPVASGAPRREHDAVRKAVLCERVCAMFGNVVTILRILKVAGSEPTYHLELADCTVILNNVNQLIEQGRLRTRIAEQTEKMIPRFKPREWEAIARMLLEAVTICSGGAEADYQGRMRMLLQDYLEEFDCTDDPQNRPKDLRKKPIVVEGRISIHSVDLRQYIFRSSGETVGPKMCASMLTAIGAKPHTHTWPGGQEHDRWLLPIEFNPAYSQNPGVGDHGRS